MSRLLVVIKRKIYVIIIVCTLFGTANGDTRADDTTLRQPADQLTRDVAAPRTEVGRLRLVVSGLGPTSGTMGTTSTKVNRRVGNPMAEVGIVEFSDYQCPYCRRFHRETFEVLRHKYISTGKVLYLYRHFPLKRDLTAQAAAIAANCAGEQSAFWPMTRRLYQSQGPFKAAYYKYLARHMQLDVASFEACLKDPGQAERVERDFSESVRLGVRGTPYFLIGRLKNGVLTDVQTITGAQPFPVFAEVIESLLN